MATRRHRPQTRVPAGRTIGLVARRPAALARRWTTPPATDQRRYRARMRLQPGQTALRRSIHPDGRIAAVQCGRVVADDDRGLLLWVDVGSATVQRTALDGTPTRALPIRTELTMPTLLRPATWGPYRTLMLTPPDAAHSVWWSWTAEGEFAGWYVNLEAPVRRWASGWDYRDHTLDVLVAADRSSVWKDEDEFAAQTGDPWFWDAEGAARIRAEGKRLIALAERGRFPFDGTWCDFRPDPAWSPTALPYWWDLPGDQC